MHPRGRRCSSLNTPGIRGRRALPARRLARLGATPHFHHGLLTAIDEAMVGGENRKLCTVRGTHLIVNLREMALDGVLADRESLRDDLVRIAGDDGPQDFELAACQPE